MDLGNVLKKIRSQKKHILDSDQILIKLLNYLLCAKHFFTSHFKFRE